MHKYRMLRHRRKYFRLTERLPSPLDLYQHLPFQIAVVSNLLQLNRDVIVRDIIDLEPRELRVILNIGSYMPIKAADIAYQSRLDAYTVSRACKKLQSFGMLEFERVEGNKKVKYLTLSEKGIDIYQKLCQVIDSRSKFVEQVLGKKDKDHLMEMLAKLEDQTEKMLAENAIAKLQHTQDLSAEQKEIIRWHKKSHNA